MVLALTCCSFDAPAAGATLAAPSRPALGDAAPPPAAATSSRASVPGGVAEGGGVDRMGFNASCAFVRRHADEQRRGARRVRGRAARSGKTYRWLSRRHMAALTRASRSSTSTERWSPMVAQRCSRPPLPRATLPTRPSPTRPTTSCSARTCLGRPRRHHLLRRGARRLRQNTGKPTTLQVASDGVARVVFLYPEAVGRLRLPRRRPGRMRRHLGHCQLRRRVPAVRAARVLRRAGRHRPRRRRPPRGCGLADSSSTPPPSSAASWPS